MRSIFKLGDLKNFSIVSISAFLLSFGAAQAGADVNQEIAERIKPVGDVCVEGDDSCGAAITLASAAPAAARSGEEIYNSSCFACHGTGVAGAPKLGDAGAWAPRVDKGIDAVVSNAINGVNAMPPRGTCADCSDDDIKAVVEYMVNNSK